MLRSNQMTDHLVNANRKIVVFINLTFRLIKQCFVRIVMLFMLRFVSKRIKYEQ